jgi:segregation and condensation protein A
MLLPRDPELEKVSPEEDPRTELVQRLLEHERFKNAAEMLQQKRMIEEAVWSNPQIQMFAAEDDGNPALNVTLFDLVKTLQTVLERTRNRPVYSVEKEDVSVPDMIGYLRDIFSGRPKERVPALDLFSSQRSRRAMICLFLAILELVKRQALLLEQNDAFGSIDIGPSENFEAVTASEGSFSEIEKEYT